MRIEYAENGKHGLNLIAPMWEKLREHKRLRSPHFMEHYAARTWQARKTDLLRKSRSGGLHLQVTTDLDTKQVVGYCVSTVSGNGQGQLESI